MNKDKTGGAAFPTKTGEVNGMTLLDYFAAKAMQGMVSSSKWPIMDIPKTASDSYKQAAAMLQERSKYINA
jgi:hypothetical protein